MLTATGAVQKHVRTPLEKGGRRRNCNAAPLVHRARSVGRATRSSARPPRGSTGRRRNRVAVPPGRRAGTRAEDGAATTQFRPTAARQYTSTDAQPYVHNFNQRRRLRSGRRATAISSRGASSPLAAIACQVVDIRHAGGAANAAKGTRDPCSRKSRTCTQNATHALVLTPLYVPGCQSLMQQQIMLCIRTYKNTDRKRTQYLSHVH